jgi:hypothetical protein
MGLSQVGRPIICFRSTEPPALVWPTPSFNVGRIVE